MGTRGVTGVVINGVKKLGYQQFDSYPGGVGVQVLSDCHDLMKDPERFKRLATELRVVDDNTPITDEAIEKLKPHTDRNVGARIDPVTNQIDNSLNWYQLTRGTQGSLTMILECGYVEDHSTFPLDSLFCEYGYVVNFDAGTFEVYKGFQTEPPTHGLWVGDVQNTPKTTLGDVYYPCNLVATWPLGDLPSEEDFLAATERTEED